MTGLCNSSANFWFYIISHLIVDLPRIAKVSHCAHVIGLPEDFLLKNMQIVAATSLWDLTYFGFLAIINALSRTTLTESILQIKSLKSS